MAEDYHQDYLKKHPFSKFQLSNRILQNLNIEGYLYFTGVIVITLLLSVILHYFFNWKEKKGFVCRYIIFLH